jgi:FAD/FMN-containing dehydrogenase
LWSDTIAVSLGGEPNQPTSEVIPTKATQTTDEPVSWTNWVGNQSFSCARQFAPADESEIVGAVRDARKSRGRIRCVGTGHSFGPIVETCDTLINFSRMRGVTSIDAERRRVSALPGTLISEFGEPLWEAGVALHNQGDIDTQTISGVVATGTHGSGLAQRSFSGVVQRLRLVTGQGEVLQVDDQEPELLRAAQVALGLLGVMTELELDVVPAYVLAERIEYRDYQDVIASWPEAIRRHRHFSCFWMPSDDSAELYGLEVPGGASMADRCYVKIYDEVDPHGADDSLDRNAKRVDRSYRIYPHTFEPNFHELEYMVPAEMAVEAAGAVRDLILHRFPDCIFPMELRTTAADEGFLSPNFERDSAVISISGAPGTDYWPFLRAIHETLHQFAARPHWGKLHFMTRERLEELFPRFDRFVELRRELDPDGVFLNDHLRELFA